MTQEVEASKCKLRFKGVENFLRRVAFNLGNTPSQTEVKIISCIPIDVTDLQQKIVQLERQLEDSRNTKENTKNEVEKNGQVTTVDDSQKPADEAQKPPNGSSKRASIVHTAICPRTIPRFSKPGIEEFECCASTNNTEFFNDRSSNERKSTVSFIFPATPSIKAINSSSQSKKSNLVNGGICSAVTKEIRRNIFKNKRFPKKKMISPLVYYTETNATPFRSHGITNTAKDTVYDESDLITKSYLLNMVRKQYESNQVLDEFSNTSHFTSPICKDVEQKFQRLYETDMCSCCHVTFQNIDDYLSKDKFNKYSAFDLNGYDNRNTYYDSSLYDLIPVKEKSVKNRKEFDTPKRKEPKIDIKCWPEGVRVKSRPKPNIVNYQATIPDKRTNTKKILAKINNRRGNKTVVSVKPTKYSNKHDQQTGMESSKSCFVDFSNLNKKSSHKLKTIKLSEKPKLLLKNGECVTTTINHSECQTSTLNPITSAPENKTENTLNQIKSILQSVLTEVKTSSQVKHNEEETKKDAIVQNVISQNNMHDRSSLLNSFTYSPYNINPYGPSCSKQMPSNCFCFPKLPHPVNCMQNYPLIIQGTERHLCTGCFRSSQVKTHKNTAIAASTNTEQFREHRCNETEKLIQEIYKSITLGLPTKEISLSQDDKLNPIKDKTCSNNSSKQNKQVRVGISELFKNRNIQMDTSRTNDTNTTIHSKILKTNSTQSRLTSTDTGIDNQMMNRNRKTFLIDKTILQTTEPEPETEREVNPHRTETKRKPPSMVSESSESEDSSETESVEADVSTKDTQAKKKTGLFCRMFHIFKKTEKSRNIKKVNEPEEPDTSDSDDYQTVYSHKTEIPKHDKSINKKSRPHSKIFHSRRVQHRQRNPEKPRRTPYMEQEYRRLWNEKLMFYNQKQRYSSEEPFHMKAAPRKTQQHPYNHSYEARSVLVDPERSYRPQFNRENRNSLYTEALNDFVYRSKFEQQSNAVPYRDYNGKRKTQENAQPNVPIGAFYKNGYQNTSPTFANPRHEQINEPKLPNDENPVNPTKVKGLSWFTKHKMGLRCGEQWKEMLLES